MTIFKERISPSLTVKDSDVKIPIHRIFCVGRNYHAHAAEMGVSVDKSINEPFYFLKHPSTYVPSGSAIDYPLSTANYHYEMELVIVIGKEGVNIERDKAWEYVYGFACGLDMTRRDLQLKARETNRPWDLGKDFEQSAVISEVVQLDPALVENSQIKLTVNGETKQDSTIDLLIWNVPEILEHLSKFYHLEPGDVILTGTPEGVGPVVSGDSLEGTITNVGSIHLSIK
ncbi:MAG: fumarylacetoacetate hydrolase family protein [Alcaligenaceae bacterium]|nr:fumarylacetoacetate hydrolase family protein [Alcaligenaceae bacterium]